MLKYYETEKFKINIDDSDEKLLSISLFNFLNGVIYVAGQKSKYPNKDFTYIYTLLYRLCSLSSVICGYIMKKRVVLYILLFYYHRNNMFPIAIKNIMSKGYKLKSYQLDEMIQIWRRNPCHSDINTKTIGKVSKLTPFEEFSERKMIEKIEKATNPNDSFLLLAICEMIKNKEYYHNLANEEKILLDFSNNDTVRLLVCEVKNRQACNVLSNLLCQLCSDNMENTNCLFNVLIKQMESNDFNDLEFIIKFYFKFMFIQDSLTKQRVFKFFTLRFLLH